MNEDLREGSCGDISGAGDQSSDDSEQETENVEINPKVRARGVKPEDNLAEYVDDEDDSENFANSESSGESSFGEESFMDQEELSESEAETSKETKTNSKQRLTYICEKCGLEVSKPALLAQHMLSHSNQYSKCQLTRTSDAVIQALQHRISSELRS